MPMPFEYQNASRQFEKFMVDARDQAGLATTSMAWNMVVGVLWAFRSVLTVEEALRFADVLPPVLRAIFVERWNVSQAVQPLGDHQAVLAQIRSVHREHNFSPENAVQVLFSALRQAVGPEVLDAVLERLPPHASEFWRLGRPPPETGTSVYRQTP